MIFLYDESVYAGMRPSTKVLNEQDRRVAGAIARVTDENVAPGAAIRRALLANPDAFGSLDCPLRIDPALAGMELAMTIVETVGALRRLSLDVASSLSGHVISVRVEINGAAVAGSTITAAWTADDETPHAEVNLTTAFGAGNRIAIVMATPGNALPRPQFTAGLTYTQEHVGA